MPAWRPSEKSCEGGNGPNCAGELHRKDDGGRSTTCEHKYYSPADRPGATTLLSKWQPPNHLRKAGPPPSGRLIPFPQAAPSSTPPHHSGDYHGVGSAVRD